MGMKIVTVKGAIEIQGQLSEVQSQLDSETAGREALANETEKVAVDISFSSRFRPVAVTGSMAVMTFLPWVIVDGSGGEKIPVGFSVKLKHSH